MSTGGGMNRFPFTASQYQELEHQALIFKYIISGMQIPPELLFSMKRNSCLDSPFSSPSSKFLSHQPQHVGWNCFQMGLGKKIDPEPGRCRRTDGKKWRCSKEAYPDSKYCERHMHRGKNRSRKPVETTTTTPIPPSSSSPTTTTTTAIASSSIASNASLSMSSMNKNPYSLNQSSAPPPSLYSTSTDTHHHSSVYSNVPYLHHHGQHPFSYSSSRPPGIGLSPSQDNRTTFLMDTGSYSQDYRRNRYLYGIKENVDEHAFFAEPSGTMKSMDDSWQLTPLTISSSSSSKQQSGGGGDYSSYLQLQSHNKQDEMKCDDQHEPHHPKTIHRFFDEGPVKGRDPSWIDVDDKSTTTTKLSISMPSSSHNEFSIFSPRRHLDD